MASLLPAVLAALAASAARAVPGESPLPPLDAGTSLLVVAPHPDDETLCCAGILQRVAHAGGRVSVAWITSGDASLLDLLFVERSLLGSEAKLRDLGVRRMREARAASALLGVPQSAQFLLGYPDRGLEYLSEHQALPLTARRSRAPRRCPTPSRRSRAIPTPAQASSATWPPCSSACSRRWCWCRARAMRIPITPRR